MRCICNSIENTPMCAWNKKSCQKICSVKYTRWGNISPVFYLCVDAFNNGFLLTKFTTTRPFFTNNY